MTKKEIFLKTNKLSELLNLALDDIELVNNDYDYAINMNTWHTREYEHEQCEVCLAGSMLAKTFGFGKGHIESLKGLTTLETRNKLQAIESIRIGDLEDALYLLGLNEEHKIVKEIVNVAVDSHFVCSYTAFELILGENNDGFYYNKNCENFKDFITFYRGIASKLNMVGL